VKGPTKERWQQLCAEVVIEQDPKRLLELVEEINRILAAKEQRLNKERRSPLNQDSEP